MKQETTAHSGIQIENTLSMAVRTGRENYGVLWWLLIALGGVLGSIFTFLSMFQPAYHVPFMLGLVLCSYGVFSFMAFHPKRFLPCKTGLVLLFLLLFYHYHEAFYEGFVFLMNDICKVIYHTDWDYFSVSWNYSETYATTVFLSFASVVIIYCLCYAVIRFQNLFLCLLTTFPYIELGFYFGVAPNHIIASVLIAFWCAMGAVHLSNFGAYHGAQKCSFLRKDNTFFPVTGMRFMVTEKIGILVMTVVLAVCLLLELLLQCTGYVRSDKIKELRASAKEFAENLSFPNVTDAFDFIKNKQDEETEKNDRIPLGELDAQMFDHIAISELYFSELPTSRLYFKFDTGHYYEDNTWHMLDEEIYEEPVFDRFAEEEFYPQNFLFANYRNFTSDFITVEIPDTSPILMECVPYAHNGHEQIGYLYDYGYTDFTDVYTIYQNSDFEGMLAMYDEPYLTPDEILYNGVVIPDSKSIAYELENAGYLDFVYEHYLDVPSSVAMGQIREEYSKILSSFDADTATTAEKILVLQRLREKMCSEAEYTLTPGKTPSDEDFAAYFLLDSQVGYCEHYATAGTLLARMAGIPARYCQGYMINCDEGRGIAEEDDGRYSVQVLDSYAHAWTEVYLDGFGWIPFEFTFSYFTEPELPPLEPETIPLPELETKPETKPHAEETTQSPTKEQTEETAAAVTEPSGSGHGRGKSVPIGVVLVIAFICLAVFAVIGVIVLVERFARRRREASFRQADPDAAAEAVYRYLCRLMQVCGVNTDESNVAALAKQAQEICAPLLADGRIAEAVHIGGKLRFSPHHITQSELALLQHTAKALAHGMDKKAGFRERLKLRFVQHLL